MRKFVVLVALGVTSLVLNGVLSAQGPTAQPASEPIAWAYAIPVPVAPGTPPAPPADPTIKHSHPGSSLTFTNAEIRNRFGPADWFPNERPVMPDIVAKGKAPVTTACTLCHLPSGKGRPENSGVTGLPISYFVQTMRDFRSGLRASADTRKGNTNNMILFAKDMTDAEIQSAAEYFGQLRMTPWIRVVETTTVPKMRSQAGMWLPLEPEVREPIGMRVIETPENVELAERLRSPKSGFIAYVPPGSVKKGETLVKTGGNGRTVACGTCHGADLQGLGPVPGIAGRSPSYLARQLYDYKAGTRRGEWSWLMKEAVAKLTPEDYVSITAYVSSLMPPPATSATK